MSFMQDFEHLKIQLEDIKLATNNFGHDKLIGRGGFGQVYKGQLSLDGKQTTVAFKCLDRKHGQGDTEFWKEVLMLSRYRHENLVSLLHFCSEGEQKILVYEYVSRGSLDVYLGNTGVTWKQRLNICLGAARGLNYLHDPLGTQQRVLHRDIKSSNILLDENWNAKLSDFGLSKLGPANQQYTYLISNVVGTPGYCDPLYWEMGFLSKESDVYSFGVVLFEVMCGRLCFEYCNGQFQILVRMWQKLYDEKRLDEIIGHELRENMDSDSLNTFSAIAYQCLKRDREGRPTMAEVVKELEIALDQQEVSEDVRKRMDFEEISQIIELAVSPASYRSRKELFLLLSKGILLQAGGKSFLSINKNGEKCEMVSAAESLFEYTRGGYDFRKNYNTSRFSSVVCHIIDGDFGIEACTKFLSTNVTYTINLVFKHHLWDNGPYVPFKYKLEGETQYFTSCVAHMREDGWLMTELFQFTCEKRENNFKIRFVRPSRYVLNRNLALEGIEFRPVEHEKHENKEDEDNVDMKPTEWQQKLSSDHPDINKWLEDRVHSTTKEEMFFLLRKGFLVSAGEKWFYISKNMKKCHMLPARAILQQEDKWIWKSLLESRFDMMAEAGDTKSFSISCVIESQLLSPQTTYASYLLYKLPENYHALFEGPVEVESIDLKINFVTHKRLIYLITPPHTPVIRSQLDHLSHLPSSARRVEGHPRLREDGWMELQVWESPRDCTTTISIHTCFRSCDKWNFTGLLVQGIEFRPL